MRKLLALTFMLLLVLGAQYRIWRGNAQVTVSHERIAGNPADRFVAVPNPLGVVIVAHGFAASKQVMQPWGYALARQGFDTYVIDEPGHGSSDRLLPDWMASEPDALGANLRAMIDELVKQGRAEPGRIALVGHSMGGNAVTTAALVDERVRATVAISSAYWDALPVDKPGNLLSLAAARDPVQMLTAVHALAAQSDHGHGEQGRQYGEFANGTARESDVVVGRNHISIVYDAAVIDRGARWIHASLGTTPPEQAEGAGQPWAWVLLALGGALGAVLSVAALLAPAAEPRPPAGQPRLGFLTALVTLTVVALAAVLASVFLRLPGIHVAMAGYLAPYFLVMAAVLLMLRLLWPKDFGFPVSLGQEPFTWSCLRGAGLFLGFVGAVGPVIHMNLSHYIPSASRLLPMLVLAVAFWLYLVQEEALKRTVASYLSPWAAVTVGLLGKLVILVTWVGANALPNPPIFLALITPISAVLLIGLELIAFWLGRWRFPPQAVATFVALVLAWSVVVTFPLI